MYTWQIRFANPNFYPSSYKYMPMTNSSLYNSGCHNILRANWHNKRPYIFFFIWTGLDIYDRLYHKKEHRYSICTAYSYLSVLHFYFASFVEKGPCHCREFRWRQNTEIKHYIDVIMRAMTSQIIGLTIIYSVEYSGSTKTSKLRVTGLCAGNSPVTGISPHKWPVTRKLFSFDDVIMA